MLLALAACEPGPAPPPTGPAWHSADLGLSLRLPEGWTVQEGVLVAGAPSVLLDAVAPHAESTGGLNLGVSAVDAPDGQSLDHLVFENLRALRASRPGLEVPDQERLQVGDLAVHRLVCRYSDGASDRVQLIYSLLHAGRLVALTFTADRAHEHEMDALGRSIVLTLAAGD